MMKRVIIPLALVLASACSTTTTSDPMKNNSLYADCHEPIWSWCLAKRAR